MDSGERVYTRRKMAKVLAGACGMGALALSGLAGCSPKGNSATEEPSGQIESSRGPISWDATADVVVAGSGCGLFAALIAANEGASVYVMEKSSTIGGTTRLSGSMCWVPNNVHMEAAGVSELSSEKIVGYLKAADTFGDANPSLLEHYVEHAREAFSYMERDLGFPMDVRMSLPLRGDYYRLDGALPQGRSLDFLGKEGKPTGNMTYDTLLLPKAEELGVEVKTNLAVSELILDDEGNVSGVVGKNSNGSETFVRAEKGVVLATGGFDGNEAMVQAFHRGPLYLSVGVSTNTGDGQLLGAGVGAALANMQNSWGVQAIVTGESDGRGYTSDWGSARSKPNSLMVNRRGRRFTNEASSYATCNPSFFAYDAASCGYLNLPAYLVFDRTYVDYYGYPGAKSKSGEPTTQPSYVRSFDSLEELALAHGINAEGLRSEVERFNGFAREGNDPDWHRGEWDFDVKANGDAAGLQVGLANRCMGPVETPPFYCVEMGPGSCGTSGGLMVDENAQVIGMADGQPIGGLYALGNCSASIFGSAYPGSGATVGAGVFQGLMAVQHMMGYGKY